MESETIKVNLKKNEDKSYKIHIAEGLLNKVHTKIAKRPAYAIISDESVAKLYGKNLQSSLKRAGIKCHLFTFPPGDKSKKLDTVEKLLDQLVEKGFTRKDKIIALGGGVTGDIAGFTASIYMRGIGYIQIPTTLLAMADSSVGGKTGVNLTGGKNLAGSFYQPETVLIDPDVLKTLPEAEYKNGLSEVLKYGVIYNREMFEQVEKNTNLLNRPPNKWKSAEYKIINALIKKSCSIKAKIVEQDEKEGGVRMILNYGHTIGHTVETLSGYKITHGQAIASGMKLINNIARNKKILNENDSDRINKLIKLLQLENKNVSEYLKRTKADQIWKIILRDKKNSTDKPKFIIPDQVGHVIINEQISQNDLRKVLT